MENATGLTSPTFDSSTQKTYESIIPPSLQFLFGSGGNILAIVILVISSKRHRWKPFYRLVLALAITDLSGNILVYPFVIKRYSSDFTFEYPLALCQHISFMFSFAFLGSALLVMVMSLDRFMAILFPFTYHSPKKNVRTLIMIIICWILSAIVCILPIAGLGKVKRFYPGSWCFIDFASHERNDEVTTYIYTIVGLIVFILTLFLNAAVIFALCRKMYMNRNNSGHRKRVKSDIYIITFLLAIVIVFSVCWIPLMAHMIKNINIPDPKDGKTELLVIRLAISNSNIDPWIYIVLRRENLEFFERCCKRGVSHTEESSQQSSAAALQQRKGTNETSTTV
ncbi:hypothetical protein FSP39_018442 [Pinctada imbricata]|uniref:G-protein coupled receptors family 1 profile domain-containing protein n=1 Tax=Pinctada imbricata TaxID=66713 RepID=A0AA89BNU9_PINIB|nr:hypothetical protein FSP39_018442 [Pinctada imbricata]